MKNIKVKSTGITRFGRSDLDLAELVAEAATIALGDADLDRIAHVFLAAYAPGPLSNVADPFRAMTGAVQSSHPRLRAVHHGVFKTGGEALIKALEVMTGDDGDVLVVGAEKMTHVEPAIAAGLLGKRESEHGGRYDATLPALGGLVTQAYLDKHDIAPEVLDRVAVKNHANGALNPIAHFQNEVTIEAVASSPLVADPLRRFHCAPVSDGAAAALLSHHDGAITIRGWGHGVDTELFQDRADITRFIATVSAADTAMRMAALTPSDVDVVEIHDAFTSFELINLEDMGLFNPGAAARALMEGRLDINGDLAVNTSGGMKARGHPIGATALSGLAEVYAQLTHAAGARQHQDARIGAVQSVGGVSRDSFVFLFEGS